MKKKFLSIFISLAMVITMIPALGTAVYAGTVGENFTYEGSRTNYLTNLTLLAQDDGKWTIELNCNDTEKIIGEDRQVIDDSIEFWILDKNGAYVGGIAHLSLSMEIPSFTESCPNYSLVQGETYQAFMIGEDIYGTEVNPYFSPVTFTVPIVIDRNNFPDDALYTRVSANIIDKNGNGLLSREEIAEVKELTMTGKPIADLKGLEVFTSLEQLDVSASNINNLDVSMYPNLKILRCMDNKLTELKVDNNPLLEVLRCDRNYLSSLDVSKNTNLKSLSCSDNALSQLDISATKVATSNSFICDLGYQIKTGNITLQMTDDQEQIFYTSYITKSKTTNNNGIVNHPHDVKLVEHIGEKSPSVSEYGIKDYYQCTYCKALFQDNECKQPISDFDVWKDGDGRIEKDTIIKSPVIILKVPVPVAGQPGRFPVADSTKNIKVMAAWIDPVTEKQCPNDEYYNFAKERMGVDMKIAGMTFDNFEAGKNYNLGLMLIGSDLPKADVIYVETNYGLIELYWEESMGFFWSEASHLSIKCEEGHVHSFASVWSKDADKHWKECVCGERSEEANHKVELFENKATFKDDGHILKRCSICGETLSEETIYAIKSVKLSATTYTYDGKVKKPTVTVKDSAGNALKKDTDYTVTYASGRKAVGKYKVTIKGKGNYSFTKSLYFKINPVKTSITSLTKGTKSFTVKWAKKATQTTGYEIQYSTSSTFKAGTATKKVTVKSNKTTSKTIKNLKAKKKYYVRVRTYKTVSGTKYYSAWCTKKYVSTK